MHIQEVILQGFKTYVNRTVISGFDQQFNAITGFNGSGKSNILDAIQFLLGSTSKQMLRLKSNLTELIYKQGCSGIEKASVSIKFRCIDRNMRPSGYQNSEELLVTRQITKDKISKFFINGLASNLTKVKNLFRSVHLNIENPHFLVKQGQITKIINLKPNQLLGMIQQTAGTAIYNKTKSESEKMLTNKQAKMDSIDEILRSSIIPQMEKLRTDRKRYTAFKEKQNQLKLVTQQIKTYEFMYKKQLIQKKEIENSQLREQLVTRKSVLKDNTQRLTQVEGKVKVLRNKTSNNIFNEFAQICKNLEQKKNEQKQMKKRIEKLHNDSYQTKQQIVTLEELAERKKQNLEWKNKQLINQQKQKDEIQNIIRDINTSKSEEDGRKILEKQISHQRQQIKQVQNQIKSMKSKLQMVKGEEELDKNTRKQIQQATGNTAKAIQELDTQISKLQIIQPPKSIEDPEITNNYLHRLEEDKKRLSNQHFQLRFFYNDPLPNFDRTKIKGKLFTLFRVKQKIHQKAIQIGAGGKLYNIVVENQMISKLVIDRQTFGKSVSIVPNNKIQYKNIKSETISQANKIAEQLKGLAKPAYQLVQFDNQIRNSIMFAFSNFIVCSTAEIAKRIAYHPKQMLSCKCVTYQGDIFERGTLTGGHTNPNLLILNIYNEYREIEDKIKEERKKFESEKKAYLEYIDRIGEYKKMRKQLQLKINRREKMKNKFSQLSFGTKKKNFGQEIESIGKRIKALEEDLEIHHKKQSELQAKAKKGGKSIDEQKKEMLAEKKMQDKRIDEIKKTTSLFEVEIDTLAKKIDDAKDTDNKNQEQILKLENRLREINQDINKFQQMYDLKQQQKRNAERDQAVSESKLQFLLAQENVLKNEQRKIQSDVIALERDFQSNQALIQTNQKQLKKIIEQCSFLDPSRNYQISESFNYQSSLRLVKSLGIDVDKLKKTARVTIDDHSYEKLVEQYNSLKEKRGILDQDKMTLINNMKDLDDKRTKTLEQCYSIVKKNLAKIFTDLLPGATAHLNAVDQNNITQGVQLQVQFSKVKKQLGELSGGQRSLLALSFILALLLYKPSPFYILDEIDSALDTSHTQNIGYMISQRFPQSQFLIISLKEGMFQNANVLFKVSFNQGQSKVERHILKKK